MMRFFQIAPKVDPEKEKKFQELETANKELQKEIEELDKELQKAEGIDDKLKDKELECDGLQSALEVEKTRNQELESDLRELAAQNSQLTVDINHFEKRLRELEGVNEECSNLRVHLAEAQTERDASKQEVVVLQGRVDSLESLVKELHESADQLHQLENDYQKALHTVDQKQGQIDHLHQVQEEAKLEHENALTSLRVKIQELENQCKFHESKNKDLKSELTTLKSSFQPVTDANISDIVQENLRRSETYPVQSNSFSNNTDTSDSLFDNEYRYLNNQINILNGQSNLTEANLSNTAVPTESSKSLDTGFEEEDNCLNSSPNKSDGDDPELYEIGKKLKELAVSDSDDDGGHCLEETEKEDSGMESNKDMKIPQEIALSESRISSLSKKGQIYVYVAKYGYDPFTQSPNENPDAELPLNAGDYVLVLGDMDEDGFYEGELVDGRKGLVPSNFIERVDNDHLADFHAAMALAHATEESLSNLHQEDLDELDSKQQEISPPRCLSLDRQLSNCIYMSWKPPNGNMSADIQTYQVYVDGELKASVRSNERTKALVENVDMTSLHRVSVRCLTKSGQSSKDAQCTILVGKDALPVPSEVKISDITATSAVIRWLPGNTNYQHSILVNGREASVVNPGICKYVLTGLDPDTSHRITIRAKNQSLNYDDDRSRKRQEQLSVSAEFHTKDSGRPDQPFGLQVEAGPQEGTLLLTWIPVTINSSGLSSSGVTGYNVYIDGRKTKEAKGATNDHVILYADDFNGYVPKQISIRTVSSAGSESEESEVVTLSNHLIKEITAGRKQVITPEVIVKVSDSRKSTMPIKSSGILETDEEIESAFVSVGNGHKNSNPVVEPQFVEPYIESSSSELSDIQEVEEELVSTEETNSIKASTEAQLPAQLANQLKKSPRPAPRKKSPSPANISADVKPQPTQRTGLHPCDIPAIEITRDSSTEKSFEDENINSPKSPLTPIKSDPNSPRKTPEPLRRTSASTKPDFTGGSAFRDASRLKKDMGESERTRNGKHSVRSPVSPAYIDDRLNSNVYRSRHSSGYSGNGDLDDNGDVDSISGEINPPMDDNHVRLFVALFDYDPSTMSPNVDFIDEELPFREGQIIKIYGDQDQDGFYRGECNGRMGYVPCNMVSEVSIDDPELIDQLILESQTNPSNKSHGPIDKPIRNSQSASSQLTPNGLSSSDGTNNSKKRMLALYDYDPQELSPNVDSEIELSFKAGDIIIISGEMDEDGFYMGEMNGVRGFVPSNFLQEAPLYEDDVLESASMVSASRSGGSISTVSRQSESATNVGDCFKDMHVAPSTGSDGCTGMSSLPSSFGLHTLCKILPVLDVL